nr:uncharacterized protein LOC112012715 [Quercus suber]
MAAAMAELTRQNQELTREIERHRREGQVEGQSQSRENPEPEIQSRGTTSRRVPHLEKEMDQMRKVMDEMKENMRRANPIEDLVHRTDSPFSASINGHPLPPKFKMPSLDSYDGTRDPFDHIATFKTTMHLQGVPDEIMCRAFPTTLKGPARRHKRSSSSLLTIEQGENESLRSFITRFNREALTVDEVDDKLLLAAFYNGVNSDLFIHKLDHGHDTDECYDLKQQIENLIRQGKLRHFVGRDHKDEKLKAKMEEPSRPPLGEIRVIIGGTSTGQSAKAKKSYLKAVQNVQLSGRPPRTKETDEPAITFTDEEAEMIHHPHDDAIVITLLIADYKTRRVLVDNGSSADILYYPAFQQMRIGQDQLRPAYSPLIGFGGMKVQPVGTITLPVVVGSYPQQITKEVNFLVVDCSSSYNAIIGRPTLNSWKAVTSTYHLSVKFPTECGVGRVQGDQLAARECYLAMLAMDEQMHTMSIEERKIVAEPTEVLEDVLLQENDPEKFTRIGTSVITHRLNVSLSSKPIRQKKRVFAPEREKAIREEVQKLTTAQFIREVYYPDWLANVVMIGRNVEVYVDDMLVKSLDEGGHLDDLQETFETLRRYKMKLNPSKCAFGVSSGKFLGFMILRKAFEWTDECQKAFQDLKHYLATAPLLSPSVPEEELYLYLAVSPHAVSSALVREEEKVQKPVYYTSRALRGAEGRYPLIEKLAFALITASRKLRHYFQGHVIVVMTDHPLKKAMSKLEAAGRLIQWAVELGEFDIRYQPRNAIKAQALADFIAEFTPSCEDLDDKEGNKRWVVHVDGSSTLYAGGVGVVLQSPEGDKLNHKVRLQYQTTNNEAEYEALLKGLELAKSVEADSVLVLGDSQLVISQVNGTCDAKEDRMKRYLKKVLRLMKKFREANFVQIPREENMEADTLAKEASANEAMGKLDEIQYLPSIDLPEMLQIEGEENWMTPIVSYLKDGRLPEGKDEARKLRVKSARYILIDEILYKRGFSQPYLRCLAPDEANYWGLDILGPFPTGTRQMKFLVVGIDYFTKWVEAEPLVKITQQNVKNFVWKDIVCRFGVPRVLVSDNGRQFDNTPFREFCEQLGIKNHYSSPSHPQANGQAEVANRSLLKIIKTRLEGAKGVWPDELPGVLWAYRTTARTPTGETPFKLAYGSEAVIPAEVHMASHRVMKYQDEENNEQLCLNLDLIDEVRMDAEQRTTRYKNLMAKRHDAMVKPRRFSVGDLVLKRLCF